MKRSLILCSTLSLFAFAGELSADIMSLHGTFLQDDDAATIQFSVSAPGDVVIRTWSYAGGVDAEGDHILAGGFDPILSVFDSTGQLIALNDDGDPAIVPADPVTGNRWDSLINLLGLSPGSYTLALTEADNFPNGPTLADGFGRTGQGNFTGDEVGIPGGSFFDLSGNQRTNQWEVDLAGVDAPASVPEPSTLAMLATVCFGLMMGVGKSHAAKSHAAKSRAARR